MKPGFSGSCKNPPAGQSPTTTNAVSAAHAKPRRSTRPSGSMGWGLTSPSYGRKRGSTMNSVTNLPTAVTSTTLAARKK